MSLCNQIKKEIEETKGKIEEIKEKYNKIKPKPIENIEEIKEINKKLASVFGLLIKIYEKLKWIKYECLKTLRGHNGLVRSVFVTQDGKIISGSDDKTIKIWGAK